MGFRGNPAARNERLQRQRTFTELGETYIALFHKLRQLGLLNPVEPRLPNPLPQNMDHSVRCEYCSGAPGHDTEKCWRLKHAIQDLIDTNKIEVQAPEAPNINQNPLPKHPEAHMIELVHEGGEPKKPSQIVMMIRATPKEKSINKEAGVQLKGEDVKPVVILGKNPSAATRKPEPAKLVITGASSSPVVVVKGVCREPVIIKPVVQTPVIDSKVVP